MAITSTAGAGITVTTAAVSDTLGTAGTTTTITFTNTFANLDNGNTGTSSYAGRLAILRPGTATEEVRYISSEITTTQVEVSEPFEIAPASSDVVDVSYIIEDVATVNGLSLINKRTNDYSSSRRLTIGTNGFLALLDGASVETVGNGSTTTADIIVQGKFHNGYLNNGKAVSGGSIFGAGGAGTADADLVFDAQAGSDVRIYDLLFKSVNVNAQSLQGSGDFQRAKFFSSNYTMDLTGPNELRDCIIEGIGGLGVETVEVDNNTIINGLNLVATSGFVNPAAGSISISNLRNISFINNSRNVNVGNFETWVFTNPNWTIDTATQEQIYFSGTIITASVKEAYSFTSEILDASANPVSGASYTIFESGRTQEAQYFGLSDISGIYEQDINTNTYTDNGGTALNEVKNSGYFLKVYDYGFQPALLPLTVDQALSVPITLSADVAITNASQSGAVVDGPPDVLRKAGINAFQVIAYDGGTGGLPTIGEEVGAGVSSATVLGYEGTAETGILILGDDYVTPIGNNATLNGSIGTFSALADNTTLDLDFEYIIDCSGLSLDTVYNSWTAQLSSPRSAFCVQDDGGVLTNWTKEAQKREEGDGSAGFSDEFNMFNTSVVNDAFYMGSLTPFNNVAIFLTATGGGLGDSEYVWEYWDGSTWQTITLTTNDGFTGAIGVEFNYGWNPILDWAPQADLTGAEYDLFYVRKRCTTANDGTTLRGGYVVIEPNFLSVIEDGANQWANPFTNVGGSYQTVRTTFNNLNHGFWLLNRGDGSVSFMTSNDGTTYTPPVQYTFTLTGLQPNTEVRIYTDDGNRTELAGVENSSTSFSYSYQYGGSDTDIYVIIHHLDYEFIRLDGLTLSNSNQSIPVQQREDRNYENPN